MIQAEAGVGGGSLSMLDIGGRAPEFTLPDHTGQTVSLSTLLRSGPLVTWGMRFAGWYVRVGGHLGVADGYHRAKDALQPT